MPDVNIGVLTAPFPDEAIKQRVGAGKRTFSYVQGHTVINRLNKACARWDFQVLRLWQEGNVLYAHVRLELPELGSREHIGVQVVGNVGGEDMAKGAVTDALKKAATLFGVGLELYGEDYEAEESKEKTPEEAAKIELRHVYHQVLEASQRVGAGIKEGDNFGQMAAKIQAAGGTPPARNSDALTSYRNALTSLSAMADQ